MLMPKLNNENSKRASIPALSGGINSGANAQAVSDNQVTDCKNVWYKGGEVITRPKLIHLKNSENINLDYETMQKTEIFFRGKKAFFAVDKLLNVIFFTADNSVSIVKSFADSSTVNKFLLYSGTAKADNSIGVYLLLEFSTDETERQIWEFTFTDGDLSVIKNNVNEKAYIPHVIINGWGNHYPNLPKDADSENAKSTQLEGYNLLNGAYYCTYTTDSISVGFELPMVATGEVKIEVDMSAVNKNTKRIYLGGSDTTQKLFGYGLSENAYSSGFYKVTTEDGTLSGKIIKAEKTDKLIFTIPKDSNASKESYIIDGSFEFYSADGSKHFLRTYYRSRFYCALNTENTRFSFPFLKEDKYIGKYSETDTFYDPVQDMNLKGTAVTQLTGKAIKDGEYTEEITVDLSRSYVAFYDDIPDDYNDYSLYYCDSSENTTMFAKLKSYKTPLWLAFPRSGNILNNIKATVYNDVNSEDFNKIIDNNISCNYGGSVGLNHGYRTFVAGNNHRVYFSDIDNPYYFPENCYFGIGSNNEKVTAFGKQNGYLVIFKENSLWYTYEEKVESGSSASTTESERVSNQTVIDITANYRYRLFNLNALVGCDLPDTVQLCMNRLIFANSSGNVYVLNSLVNYSERNVFLVSDLIRDRLLKVSKLDWKKAFSVDCQGYYMLFVGNNGFLLDYNKNEYKYVSSYTSNSNVSKYGLFSWWPWQFPKYLRFGCATDTDIALFFDGEQTNEFCTLDFSMPEDETESYITSKFFDFSAPDYYKGIEKLSLEIGNDYDSDIFVELITDGGSVREVPIPIIKTGTKGNADYLREKNIYPMIKLCRKFGFKITALGPLSLSSVIINYSVKGNTKNGN